MESDPHGVLRALESEVIRGRGVCTLAGTPWHQSMAAAAPGTTYADPHAHFSTLN
jgi:hypothetical protein